MRALPSPTVLIRTSWEFYRKQPALNAVLLWLLILPAALQELLPYIPWQRGILYENGLDRLVYMLVAVTLMVVSLWGVASILLVGRRLIQSRAGRSRTSFRAVRNQAAPLIVPLVFTSLLRSFVTTYWALLFLVPGLLFMVSSPMCNAVIPNSIGLLLDATPSSIRQAVLLLARSCSIVAWLLPLLVPAIVYNIQTTFFPIVLMTEKKRYRMALRRSKEVMHGQFWPTVWRLLQISILLFVPASLVVSWITTSIEYFEPRLAPLSLLLSFTISSIAGLLSLLCSVQLYGALRDRHDGRPKHVSPDDEDA